MYIQDEEGEELFRVKGRLLSIGVHLTIYDLKSNELLDIRQSLWMPKMPQFEIYQGNTQCLRVKKRNKEKQNPDTFSVDSLIDGSRLKVVGDWSHYEYEIHRGTGAHAYPIATIAKRMWKMIDHYSVEVAAGEDVLVLLGLAIVIDKIVHENW